MIKLFMFICLCFLFACNTPKANKQIVAPIDSEYNLDRAKESTVAIFFNYRIKNDSLEKVVGRRCEIISEKGDYIYFGFPNNSNSYPIYKISKTEMQSALPCYQILEGYVLYSKVHQATIINEGKQVYDYNLTRFDVSLTQTGISILCSYKNKRNDFGKEIINYNVLLSRNDLTLINVNKI